MAEATGQINLRKENVDAVVTGFALRRYIFKDAIMTRTGSAWTESYFQETAADLTGGTGSAIQGVPRLANFPYGEPTWTKSSSIQVKHGMEGVISVEDALFNDIPMQERTILRISRAIVRSVDTNIWNAVSENQSATNINSVSISAGNEWDSATIANRDPVKDILQALQAIEENDYDVRSEGGELWLSPKDYANLLMNDKVSRNPQFKAADVVANGKVATLLGLTVRVSNNVTADSALVLIPKEAAVWIQGAPLTTAVIQNQGVGWTIRSWEIGTCQLRNPLAVCLISNTQA